MSGSPAASEPGRRDAGLVQVVVEGIGVLVLGGAFALIANQLSPRGLTLSRDYFPSSLAAVATNAVAAPVVSTLPPPPDPISARLQAKGLQPVDLATVEALFKEPRYAAGLVVFIDARNEFVYQIGHIPGAHVFDHYRPEQHFAAVVTVCAPAEQIVVYCTGGDCEDSEFAAIMLAQAGIPADRLFIYTGGIDEWTARKLPVETGARGSGVLREGPP